METSMKKTVTVMTALAMGIAIAGCDPDVETAAPETVTVEATVTETAEAPAPAPEEETEETEEAPERAEEETEEASMSSGAGTRTDPIAVGDTGTFTEGAETFTVSVGEVNFDATDITLAENQFNEVPADGMTYAIVPVTVTYSGPDSMNPYFQTFVTFVSADGRSFDEYSAVVPDDMMHVGDIYDGASATGNFAFLVDSDATEGGTFAIRAGWMSDELFFEASDG